MAKELENDVTINEEETKEEKVDKTAEKKEEGTKEPEKPESKKAEPEKEKLSSKAKKLGKKVLHAGKKALPYVGTFVAGAGAAVGAILVLTRPDGTEVEMIEKDDSLVDAEEFIDGEAEIVSEDSEA